ncbi:MAG TPA: isochorismatase family cysteine hydrolase [Geminicoccaceae bacterium]|nr:isochorismatase family cysteine hydrolase [Geminicoccaceae bacterium]
MALQAFVYGEKRLLPDGFEAFADAGRSAVVSIDMHQGHLADTADCPCPAPRAREIVAPIDRFHASARGLGVPVVHVRSVLRRGGVDDVRGLPAAWRKVFPLHVGPIPNADQHAIEGTRWNAFETEVLADDLIVQTKKRLTAFYPSDLDFLLRNMGTRTLVLDGVMTDCCVLNTAFDASNLGYNVVVLRDLVRGTDAQMEAAALKIVSLHLGLVMDAADLVAAWRERGARQAAE